MPVIVDYDQSDVLRLPNGEPIAGSLGPDVCTEDEALVESLEMNGIEMIRLKESWIFVRLTVLCFIDTCCICFLCGSLGAFFWNHLAKLKWLK